MDRLASRAALLLTIQCCARAAAAEPPPSELGADVDPRPDAGKRVVTTLAPAIGDDIDPGDAAGWTNSGPFAVQDMPPLRLKLTWPPILHITPFAWRAPHRRCFEVTLRHRAQTRSWPNGPTYSSIRALGHF